MEAFQESCGAPHDFGTTFIHVDFLTVYTVYCTNYTQGNECLEKSLGENENLREFIEVSGEFFFVNIKYAIVPISLI